MYVNMYVIMIDLSKIYRSYKKALNPYKDDKVFACNIKKHFILQSIVNVWEGLRAYFEGENPKNISSWGLNVK